MQKLLLTVLLLYATNNIFAQNCSINAGLNATICKSDSMKLYGTRSGLFSTNSFSKWTKISGPDATILNPDSLVTRVVNFLPGSYLFKISNKCKDAVYSEDTVSVIVLPITIANAGKDTVVCPGDSYHLRANKPASNETGLWSITSNGLGVVINSYTDPNSGLILSPSFPGITKLKWTIMNQNGCTSFDEITITNSGGVMPVDAGPDQILGSCYNTSACTKLVATNGGTGLGNQIGIWTFVSGPTIPVIADPAYHTTSVCNLREGDYTFKYTVTGPCSNGSDIVKVTVPVANENIPTSNANASGMNINICDSISTITLTGNNPAFAGEVVQWTQTGGPIMTNINTPNNPSTIVTGFTKPGSYIFNYNVTNSVTGCIADNTIRITLYKTGTVDAGPDQILPCNVTETTIPVVTTGSGYLTYRIIDGPMSRNNYPSPAQSYNTFKNLDLPGTYRVEVNYQFGDECEAVNDFVEVTVSRKPTGSNAGSYQTFACASTSTQLAGNNASITGMGAGRWSEVSGPCAVLLVNPTNYICDIRNAIAGMYTFRWTINAGNTCPDNHDDINVVIPDSSITKANAGTDQTICYNSSVSLEGNAFRADEHGTWKAIPNDITFYPSNNIATPIITGLRSNTAYTLIYTITNSCGQSSVDSVKITSGAAQGPSDAVAGANQCLPLNTRTIQMNANIPVSGTGKWMQLDGPACVITNPALNNTSVTNVAAGNYRFIWMVSINSCSNISRDTVNVTVSDSIIIANAGTDVTKCTNSLFLHGNNPAFGVGQWSQISGDGSAVIDSARRAITNVRNLFTGLYTFRWTISNGVCPGKFDDVVLNISSPAAVAKAGPDQSVCGSNTNPIELHATAPLTGSGQWVWVTGPTRSPYITNSTTPNAVTSTLSSGSHVFRWIVSGGPGCPQSKDDVIINISEPANAGLDKTLCNLTSLPLNANTGSTGIWSQVTGPSANVIQTPAGNPNANISGLLPNSTYTFRYTIPAFAGCPSTFDDAVVVNKSPTITNAGIDNSYCNTKTLALNANQPAIGETGTWYVLSGQTGVSFLPNANTPNATLVNAESGTYLFKWTISNDVCANSDVTQIDNYISPTTAYAGVDDSLCFTNSITLTGNKPLVGTGKWTEISGPNQVTFDTPDNYKCIIKGLIKGTYRFAWTISNFTCTPSSDEISISILSNADIVSAGNNQHICSTTTTLKANPPSAGNKGLWSQISGPHPVFFSSLTNATTTLTELIPGTYKFVFKIYNERCFNSDTVEVVVNPSVSVYAGSDISVCNKTTAIPLSGSLVRGYTTIGNWSIVSGEGTLSSASPTNNPSAVTFTPVISYSGPVVLRLSATDNCHTATDDVTVFVNPAAPYINAINDSIRTDPNTSVNINVLKNDISSGDDTLRLCNNAIIIKPVHGTAMVNSDGTIAYKPVNGYLGVDSFNYKLCNTVNIPNNPALNCYTPGNSDAWVYVTIEGCTVPNSFSPDGDGVNDLFEIPCAQGNVELSVFNRWGIEVYQNKHYKNGWDGTYNGAPLPEGTYFYMLKYSTDNINELDKEGFITIRR